MKEDVADLRGYIKDIAAAVGADKPRSKKESSLSRPESPTRSPAAKSERGVASAEPSPESKTERKVS